MKSFSKLSKKAQRGYSLIELSIALAIVGVVIAGSIVGVQAILRSNSVNKTISQSNTAVNKIVAKLLRDKNYSNANLKNLTAAGLEVWSDTDIQSGGEATAQVTHPLNGRVYVAPLASEQDSVAVGQGLIYTLAAVPVAACADLAVGLEGLAYTMTIQNNASLPESSSLGALAGTASSAADSNLIKSPSLPYNSATANGLCNGTTAAKSTTKANQAIISFLVPRR